ncbi:MAG: hypothetical protein VYC39_19745 [Myxococcota bacterium]|nr:hypothetical protein [Myxococcota bacterium]
MRLSRAWLENMFLECGVDQEEALVAARHTFNRLITRKSRKRTPTGENRVNLRASMVTDPLVSFQRITGAGSGALPFYDEEAHTLSTVEFTFVLRDSGLTADVAMAFAKVFVEVVTPESFFLPVWEVLKGKGRPIDFDELRRTDWSPLRRGRSLSVRDGGTPPSRTTERPKSSAPLLAESMQAPLSATQKKK